MVVGVLLWQRPWSDDASTASPSVPADARAALGEQLSELSAASSRAEFVEAAGPGEEAERFAEQAWTARDELAVRDVELRYVSGGDRIDRSDGTALATVEVSWRTAEDSPVAGTQVRDATVGLRLQPRETTFSVVSTESVGDPLPVWLAGAVRVTRSDDAQVIAVDGGVPDLDVLELADRADDVARRSLPEASGVVTIVSARTRATAAALIGRSADQLAPIAAVTTTVDGTTETARVVVLNPDLFATMDPRAQQVVVSHEAVHVLSDVVGASMPPWVVEGFADYVALRDDDAPLSVSAGQTLRDVGAQGPPQELPGEAEFSAADGPGLSAVYESAWLVFRMLAEDLPHERILAFYEDVRTGADVDSAAEQHLDASVAQITERWRDYLERLYRENRASIVS